MKKPQMRCKDCHQFVSFVNSYPLPGGDERRHKKGFSCQKPKPEMAPVKAPVPVPAVAKHAQMECDWNDNPKVVKPTYVTTESGHQARRFGNIGKMAVGLANARFART
jgi:hypothetical protein